MCSMCFDRGGGMVLKTLRKTVALLLLLVIILPAAGCAGLGKDSGPVYNYAVFFADTTKYINSVGELADTSAPYMNAEWLYVPVLTVFEAIGARVKDDTVTIKGTEYDISDIVSGDREALCGFSRGPSFCASGSARWPAAPVCRRPGSRRWCRRSSACCSDRPRTHR